MMSTQLTVAEAEIRLLKLRQELARTMRRSPRGPGDESKIAWLQRECRLLEELVSGEARRSHLVNEVETL